MCDSISTMLKGFTEFKNTKAAKKAIEEEAYEGGLLICCRKVIPARCKKATMIMNFSKGLVKTLQDKNLTSFKLLYHEEMNFIALVPDFTSSAINLDDYSIQKTGIVTITDKIMGYTILPVIDRMHKKSITYSGKLVSSGGTPYITFKIKL